MRSPNVIALIGYAALLSACAHGNTAKVGAGESVPLIPRGLIFGDPDKSGPQVSPDGAYVSWLAPYAGAMNVWLAPANDISKAKAITADKQRGISNHFWAYSSRQLIYFQDTNGDENWHLYVLDLQRGEARDLTPVPGAQAGFQALSPRLPDEVLIRLNDRDSRYPDLYRVNLVTGERRVVQRNEGFAGFVADEDFQVRLASKLLPDGGREYLRPTSKGWEKSIAVGKDDVVTTGPLGFDSSGKILYLYDSRGRDTAALVAFNLNTNAIEVLAEDARADAGDVLIDAQTRVVQAVAFPYDRTRWTVLAPELRDDFAALASAAEGDLSVVSRSIDGRRWLVAYARDTGPTRYALYDRPSKRLVALFTNRSALENAPLGPMQAVVIKARDGLDLVSYMTLPRGVPERDSGRPAQPLPTVLLVHGGPWERDSWGLNERHQWLANRGYAVLSVNYRGSTGFGKRFTNAANLEWGRKMQDDLADAVTWATENGIADPGKVCIMGSSYGGYATLVGLTFTPTLFACGVDLYGPSSLPTLLAATPPEWTAMVDFLASRIGDPRTEDGKKLLVERSPLPRAGAIVRPLLVAQGANDRRVKREESDQLVAAMKANGIPVSYALFSDEGHGLARAENRLAFYAIAEQFLARHLGGRAEPMGGDLVGSSVTVLEGASEIPGLADAMQRTEP